LISRLSREGARWPELRVVELATMPPVLMRDQGRWHG
jgi:hypothetical protein